LNTLTLKSINLCTKEIIKAASILSFTRIVLFEKGIITSNILWNSRSNTNKWYEFKISYTFIKNIISDNCNNIVSDSNKTIIELIKTFSKQNKNGEIVYPAYLLSFINFNSKQ